MFTFLSLPFGSGTSGCPIPINLTFVKLSMCIASQFYSLLKVLIIIKSPILYSGVSSYLSIFCLEHASFVLRAGNIYACLNLSRQVMPSSEPRYLYFGCKKALR